MGALENNTPNTFIGGSGADYPTPASFSAATGIPEFSIKNYQVDAYNNVSCRIDTIYTITHGAFDRLSGKYINKYYIDSDGSVGALQTICFRGGSPIATVSFYLPNVTIWPNAPFRDNEIPFLYLPEMSHCGPYTYVMHKYTAGFGRMYIPKFVTPINHLEGRILGSYNPTTSNGLKNVMYIHPDMATHPRILWAQTKSGVQAIVRVVDDLTVPTSITDLAISSKTSTSVTLTFTPATGVNVVDFYEIWLEELNNFLPENRFFPQRQELTASGQTVTGLKPDTDYVFKLATVDMKYNGTGLSKTPAFSNELIFKTDPL